MRPYWLPHIMSNKSKALRDIYQSSKTIDVTDIIPETTKNVLVVLEKSGYEISGCMTHPYFSFVRNIRWLIKGKSLHFASPLHVDYCRCVSVAEQDCVIIIVKHEKWAV